MPILANERGTIVQFGSGDLVVIKATNVDKTYQDEVLFIPSPIIGKIGDRLPIFDGKPTESLPPHVTLAFDTWESVQVVIDALEDIKVQIPK